MSPYPGVGKPLGGGSSGPGGGPGGLGAGGPGALGGVGDLDASGLPQAQAPWEGRAIATHKFRLLEFSAYMELQKEDIVSLLVLRIVWHNSPDLILKCSVSLSLSHFVQTVSQTPLRPAGR